MAKKTTKRSRRGWEQFTQRGTLKDANQVARDLRILIPEAKVKVEKAGPRSYIILFTEGAMGNWRPWGREIERSLHSDAEAERRKRKKKKR